MIDRIGGGDGFAAGLIYGLLSGRPPEEALRLGWAHGALLTTFPGDVTMAKLDEVEALAKGGSARVQRRGRGVGTGPRPGGRPLDAGRAPPRPESAPGVHLPGLAGRYRRRRRLAGPPRGGRGGPRRRLAPTGRCG